jgi:hypothetical protein
MGFDLLALLGATAAATGDPAADSTDPPVTERMVAGSGEHRAGLVVDDGEEVRTVCVLFEEDEISGEDLLGRSGLDVTLTHYGTLGAAVCAIDGVGCPAEDCHCEAAYWSYWLGDDEAEEGWRSSPVGASARELRDGDLDARVWGDGRRPPPPLELDDVCDHPDAAPVPDDDPGAPMPEAVDDAGAGAGLADLVWFVLALGLVLVALLWRRRQRPT